MSDDSAIRVAKDLERVREILMEFFEGNERKVGVWVTAKNPMLGGVRPIDMIVVGKTDRLIKCMNAWREGNLP